MRTVDLRSDSVGNTAVTCRTTIEGCQWLLVTSGYCRTQPRPAIHAFWIDEGYGNAFLKVFCSGSLPGTPCLSANQSARVIDVAGELLHAAFDDIVADIA